MTERERPSKDPTEAREIGKPWMWQLPGRKHLPGPALAILLLFAVCGTVGFA